MSNDESDCVSKSPPGFRLVPRELSGVERNLCGVLENRSAQSYGTVGIHFPE